MRGHHDYLAKVNGMKAQYYLSIQVLHANRKLQKDKDNEQFNFLHTPDVATLWLDS